MARLRSILLRPILLAILAALVAVPVAGAASTDVVISEFRVRGPAGGSDELVELYNLASAPVAIGGWKINGSNSAGTVSTRATIPAGVSIPAHGHYLLTNSSASGGPYSGSVPGDQTYATGITDDGGVALLRPDNSIVDAAGLSAGSAYKEGTPLASLGSTNADRGYERRPGGAAGSGTDTDANSADFALLTPSAPQNLASPPTPGGGPTNPSASGAANPASLAAGESTLLTAAVTPGTEPASTGLAVTGDLAAIGGPAAQAFSDDGSNGDATAGDGTYSFQATVAAGTGPGAKSLPLTVSDAQGRNGSGSIALTVTAPSATVAIHDIQGAAHLSPLSGQQVTTTGIVTGVRSNGFYIQDPSPDSNPATSEGIFVFTSSAPTVAAGASVRVAGQVVEFRPGGVSTGNLTTTEIGSAPVVTVLATGNPLPDATVIGSGGRVPPGQVYDDDAAGDVETGGVFEPATDGIDFYESLEGMRLRIDDAVAVGPTSGFGETPVVSAGAASLRTPRGGIIIRPNDFNPERLIVDDAIVDPPVADVGDSYAGPLVGVLGYDFGNFHLELTQPVALVDGGLAPETTTAAPPGELAIATYNVENLDPGDGAAKLSRLADQIVDNLRSPDVIALAEVQDNTGPTNDGTVDDSTTLSQLVAAIEVAGGPHYEFRSIHPANNQDRGEPGGNIRVAFLYRTDRGLAFVDRPGAGATTPNAVVDGHLQFSPGRIDPTNAAFANSRKPLAGEFTFGGRTFFLVANHFNSKGGDDPLFGRRQPGLRPSEAQRHQQAQIVHDFVQSLETANPQAGVVVLGDINDFEFSQTLSILQAGGVLHTLIDTLPENERYTYDFEGNSQVLDHILVSGNLFSAPFSYDVVHANSEFADQASDHDPQVVRLALPPLNASPTVSAGGPYTVDEGSSVTLAATGDDPDGDALAYAWDLDGNGTFETAGQSVSFTGAEGPATATVTVRATDPSNESATATATVTVRNVAPTATLTAPAQTFAGSPFTVALTNPQDPSAQDRTAGFTYAFDCGDGAGFGPFGPATSRSCPTADVGTRTVRGRIRDDDGGVGELSATVRVVVTYDSVCALARTYASPARAAEAVCAPLAVAKQQAGAGRPIAVRAALAAARIAVAASRAGRIYDATEATTLIRLIDRL